MITPRSPLVVKIATNPFDKQSHGIEIIWMYADYPPIYQRLRCGRNLRELRHQLAKDFKQVLPGKASARNLGNARDNLRTTLCAVHSIGRELMMTTVEAQEKSQEVITLLKLLQGQPVEWQIEAEASSMFALDMLPLGWLSYTRDEFYTFLLANPELTTSQLASMLPCWQWPVIRRFAQMDQASKGTLRHNEPVRMAFVGDGAPEQVHVKTQILLKKAHHMLKSHPQVSSAYHIEEPWPDPPIQETETIISDLARHLVNPEFMPRGCHYPDHPAAITHFFCHGWTSAGEMAQGRNVPRHGMDFQLSIGQGKKLDGYHDISIRDLQDQMERHQADQSKLGDKSEKQRTLVFMNVCGGATQSPEDDVALASILFGKRHPAVIAAETTIDATTARHISTHFYDSLLQRVPAHVALWQAQRQLTSEISTKQEPFPAALLYSCYGIPSCSLGAVVNRPTILVPLSEKKSEEKDMFFPQAY